MAVWLFASAACGRLGYTTIDPEIAGASGSAGGTAGRAQAAPGVGTDAAGGSGSTGGVEQGAPAARPAAREAWAAHRWVATSWREWAAAAWPGPAAAAPPAAGGSGRPPGTGGTGTAGTGGSTTPPADAAVDLPPDSAPAGSSITLVNGTATPRRGSTAGSTGPVMAACPADQVVIGFEGFQGRNQMYPWLQSAGGVCGAVSINGLAVTITEAGKLTVEGATNGAAWTRRCPQDQVVIGFEGNSGDWMGVIRFRCAPLLVSGSGTITAGAVTTLAPVGGAADNTFPTTDCASGQVARGQDIAAGTWLAAFGLLCATPQRR